VRMKHGSEQPEVLYFLSRYEEGRRDASHSCTDLVMIQQAEILKAKRTSFLAGDPDVDSRILAAGYFEALAACLSLEVHGDLPAEYRDGDWRRKIETEKLASLAFYLETGGRKNVCCAIPEAVVPDDRIPEAMHDMLGFRRFAPWEPGEIKKLIGASAWKGYDGSDWTFVEQPTWQIAKVGGGAQFLASQTADWMYLREALEQWIREKENM
jgi:hypothetical protein